MGRRDAIHASGVHVKPGKFFILPILNKGKLMWVFMKSPFRLHLQMIALLANILMAWSAAHAEDAPEVAPPLSDKEIAERIRNADAGEAIELPGLELDAAPLLEYDKLLLPGPQYLISDDPEYIRVPEAIALQEEVLPGRVRLYVYNVNGLKEEPQPTKITAVIENRGKEPMQLRMVRSAALKPSANYYGIAKKALAEFLEGDNIQPPVTVAPGEIAPIDPRLEEYRPVYNDLVHGFYEFAIDQPGRVSVLQTLPEKSSAEAVRELGGAIPTKSVSGAGRGKFFASNYHVTNKDGGSFDTADSAQRLVVADGKIDPWIIGSEGPEARQAVLKGNYGVIYEIELDWTSSDGRALALLTWNARFGSKWCGGMTQAIRVSEGKFPEGVVMVPSNQLVTKSAPEAVVVQIFTPPPPGETGIIKLTYSPPGASCLPTPLVFIPVELE
jgi:hypothetical protein